MICNYHCLYQKCHISYQSQTNPHRFLHTRLICETVIFLLMKEDALPSLGANPCKLVWIEGVSHNNGETLNFNCAIHVTLLLYL